MMIKKTDIKKKKVDLVRVIKDGVAPENFYCTTNHKTMVKLGAGWVEVMHQKMDAVIVIEKNIPECKVFFELEKGDMVVVGRGGVKVKTTPPSKIGDSFGFMNSQVSSEKPNIVLTEQLAKLLKETKKKGKKIAIVLGPAVVHTGVADAVAEMISMGYVDIFLAGNAVAVHDIENSLHGTSLGVCLQKAEPMKNSNEYHLRTINTIRGIGSIKKAIEIGLLTKGIMYEVIQNNIPYVLAGSYRDDGPLPEVICSSIDSQRETRMLLKDKDLEVVIMVATMLHSIAVGNLLPSRIKTICVDKNLDVVTKLSDRGSSQAIGIVTDIGFFFPRLVKELRDA